MGGADFLSIYRLSRVSSAVLWCLAAGQCMAEARKLAAILPPRHCRLFAADARGRGSHAGALRNDLIHPTIALHHGRVVKRNGPRSIVESRQLARDGAGERWRVARFKRDFV
jgi:hypothetical protein